jgi:hypothetical protein
MKNITYPNIKRVLVIAGLVISIFLIKRMVFPSPAFLKYKLNFNEYAFYDLEPHLNCLCQRKIIDSFVLQELFKNARKAHHAFKYLTYCSIKMRNLKNDSLIIIKVIDSTLFSYNNEFYIVDKQKTKDIFSQTHTLPCNHK